MSTTQCARMTQSKLHSKEPSDVDPSVTDVQKDFDINSPLASETFTHQTTYEEFNTSRTSSNLQEPQQSFNGHSMSDMAKISDENLADLVPSPKEDPTDADVSE